MCLSDLSVDGDASSVCNRNRRRSVLLAASGVASHYTCTTCNNTDAKFSPAGNTDVCARGNLMNRAGITRRLLDLAKSSRPYARGLAQVSVVLSTLMGGVSGSCIADAAMEARMLGPDMIRRVSKGFAAAAIAWTSLIVPTIPRALA